MQTCTCVCECVRVALGMTVRSHSVFVQPSLPPPAAPFLLTPPSSSMKFIITRDANRLPALDAMNHILYHVLYGILYRILYFVNFNVEYPDGTRICCDTVGAGLHKLRAFFAKAKREHSLERVFAFAAASDATSVRQSLSSTALVIIVSHEF